MCQEKVREKYSLRVRKSQEILDFCQKSGKSKEKLNQSASQVYMISQVKCKNDVCSQEMYGYGSLLVLITPLKRLSKLISRGELLDKIEYVLEVTIKIIFHHSKSVCKIYKLSTQNISLFSATFYMF